MGKYILRRILQLIPVVLCVAIVIFVILYFVPGDPVLMILGDDPSPELYAAKQAELGLDKPFITQLLIFLRDIFLRFNFGTSYVLGTPIAPELFARLPRTAIIAAVSCLLQIIISIPLGIAAATHQNGAVDRICILLAMIGISLPGFWVGLMLILVFGLYIPIFPTFGVDHWYSYVLPCFANALMTVGSVTRMTRSQMLEVIRSDYVSTARAKGVPERTILISHALPNALIPVITHIGTNFGRALGGTVVIETVFSIPGVGYYMTQAINNRDYPIIRGGVTMLAMIFCLVILIMDIVYAFIDPRIKAQYENSVVKRRIKKAGRKVAANG